MKIGIVSDIHAYYAPLKIALAIFEREKVDTVVCAGDVVDGGKQGNEVVRELKRRNIPSVMGNHDYWVIQHRKWLEKSLPSHMDDETAFLTEDTMDYLRALPMKRRFEWEGVQVCLTHGTPWDNNIYVHSHAPGRLLEMVALEADADIVIMGHTHMPMYFEFDSVRFLNAGSISSNRDNFDERTCGILHLPDGHFELWYLNTDTCLTMEATLR
jgi:putative phosphoesterase